MRDNHRGCASADARAARDNWRKCSDNGSLHQIWAAVRRSASGSLLAGGGSFGSASRRVAGPDARSQRPKSPRQQARDNRQHIVCTADFPATGTANDGETWDSQQASSLSCLTNHPRSDSGSRTFTFIIAVSDNLHRLTTELKDCLCTWIGYVTSLILRK